MIFFIYYVEKIALRKKFRIRSYSVPYFPAFGLNIGFEYWALLGTKLTWSYLLFHWFVFPDGFSLKTGDRFLLLIVCIGGINPLPHNPLPPTKN